MRIISGLCNTPDVIFAVAYLIVIQENFMITFGTKISIEFSEDCSNYEH